MQKKIFLQKKKCMHSNDHYEKRTSEKIFVQSYFTRKFNAAAGKLTLTLSFVSSVKQCKGSKRMF